MATHSSVLAWRIPGTEEPVGLPSMGSHRVRHDWCDLAAAAAAAAATTSPPGKSLDSFLMPTSLLPAPQPTCLHAVFRVLRAHSYLRTFAHTAPMHRELFRNPPVSARLTLTSSGLCSCYLIREDFPATLPKITALLCASLNLLYFSSSHSSFPDIPIDPLGLNGDFSLVPQPYP